MDKFIIHFCDSTKEVNILIDGVLPTTAFTIFASGGLLEVPYSGCVSSVTIDSSVTYTIDSTNHRILFNVPSNSGYTDILFNFSVTWCNGNSMDAVIYQYGIDGFYGNAFDVPFSGGSIVVSYHGCLSSISISGVSYTIDSTNKTVTFIVPPNQLDYDEMTYSAVAHWCDGEDSNFFIIQEPYMPRGYLTFKSLSDNHYAFSNTVEYSLDRGLTWTTLSGGTSSPLVPSGSTILWRGDVTPSQYDYVAYGVGRFTSDGAFEAYGNPLSLSSSESFESETIKHSHLKELFKGCTGLVSAKNLVLSATTLAERCYEEMFRSCYSLIAAPELPATTLATNCYYNMFEGCTGLTIAPELPATTLADGCYASMFNSCLSLTIAPELPAMTLADACYASMFIYCGSLTTAPELPATTLTNSCYASMFEGCTGLTIAPELPAITVAAHCYELMFYGCSILNYVKAMFLAEPHDPISGYVFTRQWLHGVASSGTFVKNSAATWRESGDSGVPNGWTIEYANP